MGINVTLAGCARQREFFARRGMAMLAVAVGIALPWAAQADGFGDAAACLEGRIAAGQPLADCVHAAQQSCLTLPAPSAEGAACFAEAKAHWGALIAGRMAEIGQTSTEEVAAIAGIEVKYDLRGNLMQCDRMEDLAAVVKGPDRDQDYSRKRCEATAVGLAYAKLYFQSKSLN